jgi:hypothetical protein
LFQKSRVLRFVHSCMLHSTCEASECVKETNLF